jgi:hypothetical protein
MIVYKLTDAANRTRDDTQWGEGIRREVEGKLKPCQNGIHAYADPLLAVLHNPIYGNFALATAHLWECEASEDLVDDNGLKSCHRWLRTVHQIDLSDVTLEQRIKYGILCAREVCTDPAWIEWAKRWLDGAESATEAWAARAAAKAAMAAGSTNLAAWAAWAARVEAARAAAAWAARAAEEAAATEAWAAMAAAKAAMAAAKAATEAGETLDLIDIAKKAMEKKTC